MKRILSILLALTIVFGVCAAVFPAFTASAADGFRLYAYRAEGGCDVYSSEMPTGVIVDYDPSLLINGQHVMSAMISPLFAEKYDAVYLEVPTGIGLMQVYINGSFHLSAKKMERGGKTVYAAFATNVQLQLVPMSSDADLYLTGSFSGDALDAPMSLLSYETYANALSDKKTGNRLSLRTYIDMRSCKSAAGYEVSPIGPNLTLENVTYTHRTRTGIQVNNESKIFLKGSTIMNYAFDGKEGTAYSNTFKHRYLASDFCGLHYVSLYYGGGEDFITFQTKAYKASAAHNGNTNYNCYIGTADPAAVGAMPLPGDVREAVYANVASAIDEDVVYQVGTKLPHFISNGPLCLELTWTDQNGNDCTGKDVAENTAYSMSAKISLKPTNDTPPVYYTFRDDSTVFKPDAALSAYLVDNEENKLPIYCAAYPAIRSEDAPRFTQQPQDAEFYVTGSGHTPETVTFTVKAENAVSYQWYGVSTSGIAFKLSDGDVYRGTASNVLRVIDPSAAANCFYCAACSPLYPDVLSERAWLNRYYRVSAVNVNGLDAPAAGAAPDTSFTVAFSPSWSIPHTKTVEYLDAATDAKKTSFADGDKLKIRVTVKLTDDSHVFQIAGMAGNWNGQMVYADIPDADCKTAVFTFLHTVEAEGETIGRVSLIMDEPVVGEPRPSFTFPEGAPYVGSSVVSPYDAVVKPGVEYTVTVTLAACTGRCFSNATVFTLNGKELTPKFKNDAKTVVELTYTFPAKSVAIEMAEISAVIPKIGEVFDRTKCSVEPAGAEKDAFRLTSGNWEIERDKDGRVLADFTRGLRQTLVANEGYYFTPSTAFVIRYKNDDGSDAVLILNNDLTADAESLDLTIIFDPYPPIHEHTWAVCYQIEGNAKQHEFTCKYCHEYVRQDHTPGGWIIDRPATPASEGSKHKECTACGYVLETAVIPKTSGGETVMLGDVDKDGDITSADARFALRRAVDLETYAKGSYEYIACDVDRDNDVTSADARKILRASVELEDPKSW